MTRGMNIPRGFERCREGDAPFRLRNRIAAVGVCNPGSHGRIELDEFVTAALRIPTASLHYEMAEAPALYSGRVSQDSSNEVSFFVKVRRTTATQPLAIRVRFSFQTTCVQYRHMDEPTREEIDNGQDPIVIEFGASWCGYCQAAQANIAAVMSKHPGVRHLKVEDGKGKPLGRSFKVKLWPTLVYLEKGAEVGRVVRPNHVAEIEAIFEIKD